MSFIALIMSCPAGRSADVTNMDHPVRRNSQPAVRSGARWLIHVGVVLNALLFVATSTLALHYAARNAHATYFVIALVVMACALAAAVRFVIVLRRRRVRIPSRGARAYGRTATGGHRDPV